MPLRGIVTPIITPLRGPETLDVSALDLLLEHILAGGVNGVFVLGTTGEGPSLSHDLRAEVVRRTCAQVAGRVPVLVSVTDTCFAESARLSEVAASAGAAAVVLAPPYYFQYSQSDLTGFIETAATTFSLPIFLYNIPQLTKVAYDPETVGRAADIPGVLGIKDSSSDLGYLVRVIQAVRSNPSFSVLNGPEEILLDALRLGCHGGVCGGSNLRPELFVALVQSAASGDWDTAAAHQAKVLDMSNALYRTGFSGSAYLRGIKSALELSGIGSAAFAPPLAKFTDAEFSDLAAAFHSLRSVAQS